jgi:hypothetical protein
MVQREGLLVLKTLDNVRQPTIKPQIRCHIAAQATVYTDEYGIYNDLVSWGYEHQTVCHSNGEYARDEDGDGHRGAALLKFMSIPKKGYGRCYVLGCAHTVV